MRRAARAPLGGFCVFSSVGRAAGLHPAGRRFEPVRTHGYILGFGYRVWGFLIVRGRSVPCVSRGGRAPGPAEVFLRLRVSRFSGARGGGPCRPPRPPRRSYGSFHMRGAECAARLPRGHAAPPCLCFRTPRIRPRRAGAAGFGAAGILLHAPHPRAPILIFSAFLGPNCRGAVGGVDERIRYPYNSFSSLALRLFLAHTVSTSLNLRPQAGADGAPLHLVRFASLLGRISHEPEA